MTFRCSHCGEEKPRSQYSAKGAKRDTYCRPCRSAYGKEHYEANRERYVAQARAHKQRLRVERTAYLLEYFRVNPCVDCGETDPVVLEFDHLRDKLFDIGPALVQKRWRAVLSEIEKCEVVCANCHRRRTMRRGGHHRVTTATAGNGA